MRIEKSIKRRMFVLFLLVIMLSFNIIAPNDDSEISDSQWQNIIDNSDSITTLSDEQLSNPANMEKLDSFYAQDSENVAKYYEQFKKYLGITPDLDFSSVSKVDYNPDTKILTNGDGNTISIEDIKQRNDITGIVALKEGGFRVVIEQKSFDLIGDIFVDQDNNLISSGFGNIAGNEFNGDIMIRPDGSYTISGKDAYLKFYDVNLGKVIDINADDEGIIDVFGNTIDAKSCSYSISQGNYYGKISASGDFEIDVLSDRTRITNIQGMEVFEGNNLYKSSINPLVLDISSDELPIDASLKSVVQINSFRRIMEGDVWADINLAGTSYTKKSYEGRFAFDNKGNFDAKNTVVGILRQLDDAVDEHKTLSGTFRRTNNVYTLFNQDGITSYQNHVTGTIAKPVDIDSPLHISEDRLPFEKYKPLKNFVYEKDGTLSMRGKFDVSQGNFDSFSKSYGNNLDYEYNSGNVVINAVAEEANMNHGFEFSFGDKDVADYFKTHLEEGKFSFRRENDVDYMYEKGTGTITKGIVYNLGNGIAKKDTLSFGFNDDLISLSVEDFPRLSEYVKNDAQVLMKNRLSLLNLEGDNLLDVNRAGVIGYSDGERNAIISYLGDYYGGNEIVFASDSEIALNEEINNLLEQEKYQEARELAMSLENTNPKLAMKLNENINDYGSLNSPKQYLDEARYAALNEKYEKDILLRKAADDIVSRNVDAETLNEIRSYSDRIQAEQKEIDKLNSLIGGVQNREYANRIAEGNLGILEKAAAWWDMVPYGDAALSQEKIAGYVEQLDQHMSNMESLQMESSDLIEQAYAQVLSDERNNMVEGELLAEHIDRRLFELKAEAYKNTLQFDKSIETASKIEGSDDVVEFYKLAKASMYGDVASVYEHLNNIDEDSLYFDTVSESKNKLAKEQFRKDLVKIQRDLKFAQKNYAEKKIDAESIADPSSVSLPGKIATGVFRSINVFNLLGVKEDQLVIAEAALNDAQRYADGFEVYSGLLDKGLTPNQIQTFVNSNDNEQKFNLLGGGELSPEKTYVEKFNDLKSAVEHPYLKQSADQYQNGNIDTAKYSIEIGDLMEDMYDSALAIPHYELATKSVEYGEKAQEKLDYLTTGSLLTTLTSAALGSQSSIQNLIEGNYKVLSLEASPESLDKYGEISQMFAGDPLTIGTLGFSALKGLGLAPEFTTITTAVGGTLSKIPGASSLSNGVKNLYNAGKGFNFGTVDELLPTFSKVMKPVGNTLGKVTNRLTSGDSFFLQNIGPGSKNLNAIAKGEKLVKQIRVAGEAGDNALAAKYWDDLNAVLGDLRTSGIAVQEPVMGGNRLAGYSQSLSKAKSNYINERFFSNVESLKDTSRRVVESLKNTLPNKVTLNLDDYSSLSANKGQAKLFSLGDETIDTIKGSEVVGLSDETASAANKQVDELITYMNKEDNAEGIVEMQNYMDELSKSVKNGLIKQDAYDDIYRRVDMAVFRQQGKIGQKPVGLIKAGDKGVIKEFKPIEIPKTVLDEQGIPATKTSGWLKERINKLNNRNILLDDDLTKLETQLSSASGDDLISMQTKIDDLKNSIHNNERIAKNYANLYGKDARIEFARQAEQSTLMNIEAASQDPDIVLGYVSKIDSDDLEQVHLIKKGITPGGDNIMYSRKGEVINVKVFDGTGHGVPGAVASHRVEKGIQEGKSFVQLHDDIYKLDDWYSSGCSVGEINYDKSTKVMKFKRMGEVQTSVIKPDGSYSFIDKGGSTKLGFPTPITEGPDVALTLGKGDKVFMYTDGITDISHSTLGRLDDDIITGVVSDLFSKGHTNKEVHNIMLNKAYKWSTDKYGSVDEFKTVVESSDLLTPVYDASKFTDDITFVIMDS